MSRTRARRRSASARGAERAHDRGAEITSAAGHEDAHVADICLQKCSARQKTGSVVCASCGSLVGVNDERCYSCGRRNPGLWGFGPMLRRFGNDLGFVTLVVYGCSIALLH